MIEEKLARLNAHRNNIGRYRRLLRTKLTDLERDFILRRLEQEERAVRALSERDIPRMALAAIAPQYVAEAGHV